MNQLNKNRLIGGGVLLFAGLLFTPTILTPEPHNLSNPTLTVRIDSDNLQAKPSQIAVVQQPNTSPSVAKQPSVQLESIDTPTVAKQAATPNQKPSQKPSQTRSTKAKPVPVVLESAMDLGKASASVAPVTTKTNNVASTSWLRVGSFSSKANANHLAEQLKKKRHAVKIEIITVDGKNYRRVLVGPFTSEQKLQSAQKAIRTDGYKPSIQR